MKTVPFSVKPIVRARKIFRAFSTRPSRRNYNSATSGRRDYNESNQKPPLSYHGAARREDYWQPPTHCVFLWTKECEPLKISSMRDNNTMKLRTRKLWTGSNLLQCWTSVLPVIGGSELFDIRRFWITLEIKTNWANWVESESCLTKQGTVHSRHTLTCDIYQRKCCSVLPSFTNHCMTERARWKITS